MSRKEADGRQKTVTNGSTAEYPDSETRRGGFSENENGWWLSMCKRGSVGGYCAAFGAGLLAATLLPEGWILFVLAAALIVVGCGSCKR